ncbi:MAG TPA: RdgB/HAM1 family non-canonical purine NTP pyrophosphatase [Chthoniobacterales bacterium]|nr:RdgB/HAM1 family non-canonical purine NTP pyrophosphatase [Chthoniobacterales bacterium]
MLRLILATRNPHKTREFREILGADFDVSDLTERPEIPAVLEDGQTFAENAIRKAVATSLLVSEWVVADDSGLEVAVLRGAPGVRSARFAGEKATDSENVTKLLAEVKLADPGGRDRRARFHCALALARAGQLAQTVHGTVEGNLIPLRRGARGFGYDPVFAPDGYDQTFAELGDKIKNQVSHRARAIARLREHLQHNHLR